MACDNSELNRNAEISSVAGEDSVVVTWQGRVDMDSSPALRDSLLAVLHLANPNLVHIDLSAVTHLDSSAVATLIEALKIARSKNKKLALYGLNSRLLRFFEITGLLALFNGSV